MKKLNVTVIRASVLTVFIALSATHASADTFTYSSVLFGGFNRPDAGVPPTTLSGTGTYNFTLATGLAGVIASSLTHRRKRL